MREMWELPHRGVRAQLKKILLVAAAVWAVAALPLVIWLAQRQTPIPTPPPQRQLTVMEAAAVRYAAAALTKEPVTLTSTVVAPMAELEITETVDPVRKTGHGMVRSGSQTAELLVISGRTLLRGSAGFWSTVGVPTTEPGWVDVGDRLGVPLSFPLPDAVAKMTPGPQALMDTTAAADATTATFRNEGLAAVFGNRGVTSLNLDERTAAVAAPTGPEAANLAASPPPGWDVGVAVLAGGKGALTVNPPAPAAPPPPAAAGE